MSLSAAAPPLIAEEAVQEHSFERECFEASYIQVPQHVTMTQGDLLAQQALSSYTVLEESECYATTCLGVQCERKNLFLFPFCKWHLQSICGLEVRHVPEVDGLGLFTLRDIQNGEFVTFYSGDLLNKKSFYRRYQIEITDEEIEQLRSERQNKQADKLEKRQLDFEKRYPTRGLFAFQSIVNPNRVYDALTTASHPGRYINDYRGLAERPNIEFTERPGEDKLRVIATENIPANSQILGDYGERYWKSQSKTTRKATRR